MTGLNVCIFQGLERVLNTKYLSVNFIQHIIDAVIKQLRAMSKIVLMKQGCDF